MISNFAIDLDAAGVSVTLQGSIMGSVEPYAVITDDEIKGLYSTPTAKTSLTERQTANGAHDIAEQDILYSARTVTVDFAIISDGQGTRPNTSLYDLRTRFGMLAGHKVRMTVRDQGRSTFLTGYAEIEWSGRMRSEFDTGTLTLTCPDPVRYSVDEANYTLIPATRAASWSQHSRPDSGSPDIPGQGLYYDGQKILHYPIIYYKGTSSGQDTGDQNVPAQQNVVSVSNAGSTVAYPVIESSGDMPDGIRVDWASSDGMRGTLAWDGSPGSSPTVFDCRTRTVSIGGLDQTSLLTRRGFPHIPPHGSTRMILQSPGSGWVTVKTRDTWI